MGWKVCGSVQGLDRGVKNHICRGWSGLEGFGICSRCTLSGENPMDRGVRNHILRWWSGVEDLEICSRCR